MIDHRKINTVTDIENVGCIDFRIARVSNVLKCPGLIFSFEKPFTSVLVARGFKNL
jgi:hypothetical protein